MRRARWLASWRNTPDKPAIYHCISRVVDRRFVFADAERETFRTFLRKYERFSGCRVLAYCILSNHFHLLLEIPPKPPGGPTLTDSELLDRLSALYTEPRVAEIAALLSDARQQGNHKLAAEIHAAFTYRMNDLSEFMKGLLIRFTRWFNRRHNRKGTLWEERFKSVIVEDGIAARTIAAYIDLNPVRAGLVSEPADYRWSSYGEAIGGGMNWGGKRAREGLVRVCLCDQGVSTDAREWRRSVAERYRAMLLLGAKRGSKESPHPQGKRKPRVSHKVRLAETFGEWPEEDTAFAHLLHCRVRYFTDGAVIGGREFVNEAFTRARQRFGPRRKDGARALKGRASAARGILWSLRDLCKNVS